MERGRGTLVFEYLNRQQQAYAPNEARRKRVGARLSFSERHTLRRRQRVRREILVDLSECHTKGHENHSKLWRFQSGDCWNLTQHPAVLSVKASGTSGKRPISSPLALS